MTKKTDVTIVGGGMITNDLLLPSIYHLQRTAVVGKVSICALNTPPLKALKDNAEIHEAFPGQDFHHLAFDDTFGVLGILGLLNNNHLLPGRQKSGQIFIGAMMRNAGQRNFFTILMSPRRQSDI